MVRYCGPPLYVMLKIASIRRDLYTHAMATRFTFFVEVCAVAFSLSLDLPVVLRAGGMVVVRGFLTLVFFFLAVDLAIRRRASSSLEGDSKGDMANNHK